MFQKSSRCSEILLIWPRNFVLDNFYHLLWFIIHHIVKSVCLVDAKLRSAFEKSTFYASRTENCPFFKVMLFGFFVRGGHELQNIKPSAKSTETIFQCIWCGVLWLGTIFQSTLSHTPFNESYLLSYLRFVTL